MYNKKNLIEEELLFENVITWKANPRKVYNHYRALEEKGFIVWKHWGILDSNKVKEGDLLIPIFVKGEPYQIQYILRIEKIFLLDDNQNQQKNKLIREKLFQVEKPFYKDESINFDNAKTLIITSNLPLKKLSKEKPKNWNQNQMGFSYENKQTHEIIHKWIKDNFLDEEKWNEHKKLLNLNKNLFQEINSYSINKKFSLKQKKKIVPLFSVSIDERRKILENNNKIEKFSRDQLFVKKVKEYFFSLDNQHSVCDLCGKNQEELWKFQDKVGDNIKYIELHHRKSFSKEKKQKTYYSFDEVKKDFMFLCPNCHYIEDYKNLKNELIDNDEKDSWDNELFNKK